MLVFIFLIIIVIIFVVIISSTLNKKKETEDIIDSSIQVPSNLKNELEKAIKKDKENVHLNEELNEYNVETENTVKEVIQNKDKFHKKNDELLVSINETLSNKTFENI